MNILGRYKIIYWNGMVQHKNLIEQSDYDNIIKPKLQRIQELKSSNGFKKDKDKNKEVNLLKSEIKEEFGEYYFTEESILGQAIGTGVLKLPENQGGHKVCKIIKV